MANSGWITVGVDGSDAATAATRWAAREASRRETGLRIVHVFTEYIPMVGFYAAAYPVSSMEGRHVAQRIVAAAAAEAERLMPAERIETAVLRGDRRAGLLEAAAESRVMVLGDQPRHLVDRMITGSTAAAVAAHSPTPVVLVPSEWDPAAQHGVVVAGVKSSDASHGLVRRAFEIAAEHDDRLVVLHAWEYPAGYDDLIVTEANLREWEERARKELTQLIEEFTGAFPGVETEVRVRHGQPAHVLLQAAAGADMLVITRRPHGFPFGHLGATGRTVLRETPSPVMVLPPSAASIATADAER